MPCHCGHDHGERAITLLAEYSAAREEQRNAPTQDKLAHAIAREMKATDAIQAFAYHLLRGTPEETE